MLYYVNGVSDGGLSITGQRDFCIETSREVILYKTLKVKREADKVKAVYLLGSGWAVKLIAEVLDIDEQTVRQYFLDYKNQDKSNQRKNQWVKLHYTGKESSLTNEQEQELIQHLDGNLSQRSQDVILYIKATSNNPSNIKILDSNAPLVRKVDKISKNAAIFPAHSLQNRLN